MELNELKCITAANIIALRTDAGLTQAELGEKLNYSDKSISKWERAEALPDAMVLKQMGELFGVPVDYILSSHDAWENPYRIEERMYNFGILVAMTVLGIMTAALTAFVIFWIFGIVEWRIFIIGACLSAVAFLLLDVVLNKRRNILLACIILTAAVFALIYCVFLEHNLWQLFLIALPIIGIIVLTRFIKKGPNLVKIRLKRRKKANNPQS